MRIFVAAFCLLFSACIHAQQSFPGINITPSGGNAGKINLRNSANVNKMFLQESTISNAGAAQSMNFIGATATDGRIIFTPGNVASNASVIINAIRASEPALKIKDSTTGGTSQGLDFEDSAGASYLRIDTNGGSPEFTTAAPLRFIGTSITDPVVSITNFLGGGELKIGSNSGVVKLTTGLVGTVSGSATDCVLVNGTSTACSSGANTTLSNLTSPTSINQILNMNANAIVWGTGTNIQNGQVGIWGGGVQRALLSHTGAFGSGILELFNTAGDRAWGFKAATATTGSSVQWVLPTSDGAGFFKSDGAGNMSIDTSGHTGTTCSAWTNGLCTAP